MEEIQDDRAEIHENIEEEKKISEDLGKLEAEAVVLKPARKRRERLREKASEREDRG